MLYLDGFAVVENTMRITHIYDPVFPEQMTDTGFYADSLPRADTPEGMYPVLLATLDTHQLYYNYEALPDPIIPENPSEDQTLDNTRCLINVDYRL